MIEGLTRAEYDALLRNDFALFAARCFHDLNPQTELAMSWHLEVIAAKLANASRRKAVNSAPSISPEAIGNGRWWIAPRPLA